MTAKPMTPERLDLARAHAEPRMRSVVPNAYEIRGLLADMVSEVDRLRGEAAQAAPQLADLARLRADIERIAAATGVDQEDGESLVDWLDRGVHWLRRSRDFERSIAAALRSDIASLRDGDPEGTYQRQRIEQPTLPVPGDAVAVRVEHAVRPGHLAFCRLGPSPVIIGESPDGERWGSWSGPPSENRVRYPLLIAPDDVGSRAPLDPIGARACRRLRACEVAALVPWPDAAEVAEHAGHDPVEALYAVAELLTGACSRVPGVFFDGDEPIDTDPAHMSERQSARALAAVTTPDEFAAWCDAWTLVSAWVCEGDEPSASAVLADDLARRG